MDKNEQRIKEKMYEERGPIPTVHYGVYNKKWKHSFKNFFIPEILREIVHDWYVFKVTYQQAKAIYHHLIKDTATLKELYASRRPASPKLGNPPLRNENRQIPLAFSRYGCRHINFRESVNKENALGENLYKKTLESRFKTINALKGSKYPIVPYAVLILWMLRHVIFVRHFKGGVRNYLRTIPLRIYNNTVDLLNRIFLNNKLIRRSLKVGKVSARLALNLLLIGPVYRRAKSFLLSRFPSLSRFNPFFPLRVIYVVVGWFFYPLKRLLLWLARPKKYNKYELPVLRFLGSVSYFFYFFILYFLKASFRAVFHFFLKPARKLFLVSFLYLITYPSWIFIKPVFFKFNRPLVRFYIIVSYLGLVLYVFFYKFVIRRIPGPFKYSVLKASIKEELFHFLYFTYATLPIYIFIKLNALCMAIYTFKARFHMNHLVSLGSQPAMKVKLNPIRRIQLKYNKFKYLFSRYQLENIMQIAVFYLYTIPSGFYNLIYKRVGNYQVFHRVFWRGFLVDRFPLIFPKYLNKRMDEKMYFSAFAQKDDFSITNFFSFDSSLRKNRYVSFEYDTWHQFEGLSKFRKLYKQMIYKVRTKRRGVVKVVYNLVWFLSFLPPALWRLLFKNKLVIFCISSPFFLPAKFWDFFVVFIHFVIQLIRSLIVIPFFIIIYLITKVLNIKEVLLINIYKFDRYSVFGFFHFLLATVISIFLLLEFFYFFGWYILYAQNLAMKWMDPFFYNWLFLIIFFHFCMSFVSHFFATIWREAKHYFFVYPLLVYVWLIWWITQNVPPKKWPSFIHYVGVNRKYDFLASDYLKGVFMHHFMNTGSHFQYFRKYPGRRAHETSEGELSQFVYDYVTSLFS